MPGTTANYAIRYPCPGDTITTDVFSNWANDIESAVLQVSDLTGQALNRPRAMLRTVDTGYAVAFGLPTQILFDEVVYNNGLGVGTGPIFGAFDVNGTSLDQGLYLFMAQLTPVNTATTVTSFEAEILTDNVVIAARTLASSAASTIAKPITLAGLGFLTFNPGGGGLVRFNWTGTGGPLNIYCQFSCQYIAPAFP